MYKPGQLITVNLQSLCKVRFLCRVIKKGYNTKPCLYLLPVKISVNIPTGCVLQIERKLPLCGKKDK